MSEIVIGYCFEFARASKGSEDLLWREFYRFIKEKATNNSYLTLSAISNAAYCLTVKEDIGKDESLWKYLQ